MPPTPYEKAKSGWPSAWLWRRGDAESSVPGMHSTPHRDKARTHINAASCRFWFSEEAFRRSIAETKAHATVFAARAEVRKPCHRCKEKKTSDRIHGVGVEGAQHGPKNLQSLHEKRPLDVCHLSLSPSRRWSSALGYVTAPSGRDGTQECNRCIQFHTVRRAAARARKRLEARRRTTQQRAIMEQVRTEIAISRPETQRRRFETKPATGQRPGQRKKALVRTCARQRSKGEAS